MTCEVAHEEEGFMSVFKNSQRRTRRKGLCNIFGDLGEEERISLINRLITTSSPADENGEVVSCTAMDTTSIASPDSSCCYPRKNADLPGTDHSDERGERLSGVTEESSPPAPCSMETARPSCLVGLKPAISNNSSSSSASSSSTSPSSMSSQTSSSVSLNSLSCSSSSSSRETKVQSCSPVDGNTCSLSTTTHGFTTSPSTSSLCYDISFSRVRRNALHDLFETLTQDDLEKLKNLYQTALSTAYSLKPFPSSDQTQSPIRGFHECKA